MRTFFPVLCVMLACNSVQAGDDKAAAANGTPTVEVGKSAGRHAKTVPGRTAKNAGKDDKASSDADAAARKPYVTKNKSVFPGSASDHNPFWPIGWVKTEALASGGDAPVMPHNTDFTVTTIMLNEPPMAVINGKDMAEGETAALTVGSQQVMVQLMSVKDGYVILQWQNQKIVVPLHRNETLSAADTQQSDAGALAH